MSMHIDPYDLDTAAEAYGAIDVNYGHCIWVEFASEHDQHSFMLWLKNSCPGWVGWPRYNGKTWNVGIR